MYEAEGSGHVSSAQWLYPQPAGETELPSLQKLPVHRYSGEQVEPSQAEAFRIMLPDASERLVLISHRPPAVHADSYIVAGHQVFGEVVVIEPGSAGTKIKVIK
ncbi:hypothetical protein [Paenibacillus tepidiphilus]|uniref:hypothetical protein n=1 Tax=Paenibacillus tepidiphilus TaxID=2608683 RepID=UPI00123C6232|nr:hypothetical protein [Paenibacillus tepidiphilus]